MLKYSTEAQHQRHYSGGPKPYEQAFIERCHKYRSLPGYHYFEVFAQQCIDYHCADNYDGVTARFFIDFMMKMTDEDFDKWLKRDMAQRLLAQSGDIPDDDPHTASVRAGLTAIKRAAELGILHMPDDDSIMVCVRYGIKERWEPLGLLESAIDLVDSGNLTLLEKTIQEREKK